MNVFLDELVRLVNQQVDEGMQEKKKNVTPAEYFKEVDLRLKKLAKKLIEETEK